jgi:hypothetical protein
MRSPHSLESRHERDCWEPKASWRSSREPTSGVESDWRGNECGELLTDFLSVAELQKAGKLKRVTSATRNRLARNHSRGVFYVEGEFTASIYPEGPLGIPYEIAVGD